MTDILQLTATELGDAIDKGDLGPIEITKTYLDAITAHPLSPRIYSELTQDRALAEAKDAEERARLGTAAITILMVCRSVGKICTTQVGIKTEAGSLLLKEPCAIRRCAGFEKCDCDGGGVFGQNTYVRIGVFWAWVEPKDGNIAVHP